MWALASQLLATQVSAIAVVSSKRRIRRGHFEELQLGANRGEIAAFVHALALLGSQSWSTRDQRTVFDVFGWGGLYELRNELDGSESKPALQQCDAVRCNAKQLKLKGKYAIAGAARG